MPKSYWEYDSVNITWGFQENYEVVRKIGSFYPTYVEAHALIPEQAEGNTPRSSKASTS